MQAPDAWERQLQQLQKTESLSRMAGAIAHHFNNLLMVVIGNLDIAMDEPAQVEAPFKCLTAALQAADRAAEVSGLMLTYLGQSLTKLELLDLADACRSGLPPLNSAITKNIALKTEFPSPGPVINANANQIQRMLRNLVVNAAEAIGDNEGTIALTLKTIPSSLIPAAHRYPVEWAPRKDLYACLEVGDTGFGIAAEDFDKLFDPFFSSKFTGRGLGLSVVLGILRAHCGGITVESEPGRGSTFRIFLPVSLGQVVLQPETTVRDVKIEDGGTVLLVEDNAPVRDIAMAMLTRLGFTVLTAQDGFDAVEMFRHHQADIRAVVCDLTMPRMDGWETLTALRTLAPEIPFVLTSGKDEALVMQGDHPERPQAFLQKPFVREKLRMALEMALQSSTP